MSKQGRRKVHHFLLHVFRDPEAGPSAQPALGITWERMWRRYKEGTRKEMRTRTVPSWVFNSLNPSSTCKISHINNSSLPLWFWILLRTPFKYLKVLYKLRRIWILVKGVGKTVPPKPIQVLLYPTHKLPTHNFVVKWWKTESMRDSGKRIQKDENRRSIEEGGRRRQPEYLKDKRRPDNFTSFLGDSFSHARKTRYKNVALLREAKRDWKWEHGNSSCRAHLYSRTFFFVDDNLDILTFHMVLFREGTLKYVARSRGWGLCGDSTLSYLQRKRSFLFSEENFRTGMNPRPFPGTASTQLRLGRNSSPEWRWPAWLTRLHAGFRQPVPLSPGLTALSSGADSPVSTTELGPWLRPAFPGNPRGRGGSVVSFPLHLGFFFHFIED